eukprot:13214255-Alexandrium_andersonii.AAC.1
MGRVERLGAGLFVHPIRPANMDGLGRRGVVDLNTKLSAKPDVAAPEVGPGPARQALEPARPAQAA